MECCVRGKAGDSAMTLRSGEVMFSEQSESFLIPESVSVFGFTISFYGVCLVIAALVGILVVTEITRRKKYNTEFHLTLLTLAVVSALVGGRVFYVLFEWQYFVQHPLMVLNFRSGGLSYYGALLGAWFTIRGYCRKRDAEFLLSADVFSLGAAAAAPFVWCGCAFVREPLGKSYEGLFAVKIGGEYGTAGDGEAFASMHPVAIYGMVSSVLLFLLLCVISRKAKQTGTVFSGYLVLQSVTIFVLECFRADSYCIWGTDIPVNFVVAGVMILTIVAGGIRQISLQKKLKKIRFNGS